MYAMRKHFKLKSPGTLPHIKIYVRFGKAGRLSIYVSISIINSLLKRKTGELSLLFCVSNLIYQSNPIDFQFFKPMTRLKRLKPPRLKPR